MKFVSLFKVVFAAALTLSAVNSESYSQEKYTIKHTQSGDNGMFSVTQQGSVRAKKKISVNEISLSISGTTGRTVDVSAEITVEETPEVPKTFRTSIKSYADSDFERKVEYRETVTEDGEGSGSYEEHIEEIAEESVPVKLYLEVNVDGDILTYDFWDKSDLESVVSGINSQYGSNLEVTGEGRAVSVRNASFEKKIEEKTVNARLRATKMQVDQGSMQSVLKFDAIELANELIKDKIMNKERAGNFTVLIDTTDIYVNGNKIADKLLSKYRKIFNNFYFEFDE